MSKLSILDHIDQQKNQPFSSSFPLLTLQETLWSDPIRKFHQDCGLHGLHACWTNDRF